MAAVNEFQQMPATHLGALLDAGDGAVVTLEAGETRLAAHRAVLCARSPVFAAMFQHKTLEASSGHVSIADVEGPVLRELLAYCYTLQVPQLPSTAPQLLAAADKYGLTDLKDACEQQLAAQLTVENAAAAAVLALSHSCPSLKRTAVGFLKAHTHQVVMTQGWADALFSHPHCVLELTRLVTEPSAGTSTACGAQTACWPLCELTRPRSALLCSTSATKRRRLSPSTQPCSGHGLQAAATAAAPTAALHHTAPPDDATVSHLRSLSREDKGRRLIRAAEQGAVDELRALLASGVDVRVRDAWGRTAVHCAVEHRHAEAARCLVRGGAEVDARSVLQDAPLHSAARSGDVATVRLLLAASADPNARDEAGWTPLHWAAAKRHADVSAALLAAGADRRARDYEGKTPLDFS